MIIAGTESSSSIHNTTNNGAAAVAQIVAKLEVDVGYDRLDGDWEHEAMNTGVEGLRIVEEHNMFAASTLCRAGHRCSASHIGDQ